MTTHNETKPSPKQWKQILVHELFEYFFNFTFLAILLVAFAWYRRLLLEAYHIQYLGYWAALVEAAILAKVIMIGDALRIGRRFQNRPLAITTLYRTAVFTAFVALFSFAEHIVSALIHGKTVADGLAEIADKGAYEILARCVVIVAAFVPFFTLKEIERAFGAEKIRGIFFRGAVDGANSSIAEKGPTTGQPH